jgi:hypothetical protein
VRCLERCGAHRAAAEEVAAEACADLRSAWSELRRGGDADVTLYLALLRRDDRRRRREHEPPLTADVAAPALREVAGLEEVPVCEVLGISVPQLRALMMRHQPVEDALTPAGPPVSYAAVRRVAAGRRRRRSLMTASVAAVLAACVWVAALAFGPHEPPRPGDALSPGEAAAEGNPADVVWWADGVIHLAGSTVRVGAATRLVEAGGDAAYVDGEGRLVLVRPDGGRTFLGRPAPRTGLVSSPGLGLVAWTDVTDPAKPRLVVWDVAADRQLAAVACSARTRAIGFDGGWLTYGVGLTDWAWDPKGGPPRETGDGYIRNPNRRSALVDVVAGTRLEQLGYALRVVRVGSQHVALVSGLGGSLSPDGRYVLTGPAGGRQPDLYDARTGERVAGWFPPEWRVRAASFVGDDRVAWLVDRGDDLHPDRLLVTCAISGGCTDVVEPPGRATPLLAQDTPY